MNDNLRGWALWALVFVVAIVLVLLLNFLGIGEALLGGPDCSFDPWSGNTDCVR